MSLRNQLLATLPSDDFQRLRPTLDVVSLDVNAILHRAGQRIEHVYFPRKAHALSVSMVQAAMDACYRLPADVFHREMHARGSLYDVITRFRHAHERFLRQSTACNAAHRIEQRLARWLLIAHDHLGVDAFPLTRAFVAMMLGVPTAVVPNAVRASE